MPAINNLFKNEAQVMLLIFFLPLVVGIVAAIVVPYVKNQLAIDRCLDNGGSYNYEL